MFTCGMSFGLNDCWVTQKANTCPSFWARCVSLLDLTPQLNGLLGVPLLGKEGILARDNYSYKKYQKELAKKKKAEEKMQRKLNKKNIEAKADSEQASSEDVTVV